MTWLYGVSPSFGFLFLWSLLFGCSVCLSLLFGFLIRFVFDVFLFDFLLVLSHLGSQLISSIWVLCWVSLLFAFLVRFLLLFLVSFNLGSFLGFSSFSHTCLGHL
ncbi:hypothetical protein AMTRI_Chr09g43080 [Amborella trichopoda]